MAAATAALDTYELLESIIALLTPKNITQAQRVSKTWEQLIRRSKKITKARVQHPLPEDAVSVAGDPLTVYLTYHSPMRMSFHPTFKSYSYQPTHIPTWGWEYPITLMVPVRVAEDPDEAAESMLTDPPITKALLYYSEYAHSMAELYAPSGITVKDVIKAARSVINTEYRYCDHHSKVQKIAVTVAFTVLGAQPRFQSRRA